MEMGRLSAAVPMRLGSTQHVSRRLVRPRLRLPGVPPKLTSAAMGFVVGGVYALALGHPALWISIGVVASLWLGKAGREAGQA